MRNRSTLPTLAVLTVLALTACAEGRNLEGVLSGAGGRCVTCHGGLNDETGAPPLDAHGLTSSAAVGAHQAHLGKGVACASCHASVNLSSSLFAGHRNGAVDVAFGAVAFDPSGGTTPSYDATAHTCSNVYCHAPSTVPIADRGPEFATTTAWDAPPGSITGCGACHLGPGTQHGGAFAGTQCVGCHPATVDTAGNLVPGGAHLDGAVVGEAHGADWATGTVTTLHGLAATFQDRAHYPAGIEGCKACHGANLSTPLFAAIPSCDSSTAGCHGSAAWRTNCTFCHGDALRTSNRPAPPRDAAGRAASAGVGAHQAHLAGNGLSSGVACEDCHGGTSRTLPGDFVHANGTTEVTLKRPGATATTGAFASATGTCTNTYCHGGFTGGNGANAPRWTDVGTQATCTTCHGFPPATGSHPPNESKHNAYATRCNFCHAGIATAAVPSSAIDPAGASSHVDGRVHVGGQGIYRWDAANKRCYGVLCHGDQQNEFKTW